jgi:uncharacterized protein
MKEKVLKPVHIIHLLLFAPTTAENQPVPILGRTRLMKMIFVFEKELAKHFQNERELINFDFEAHSFGPYSKKVYEAIDFLETREIIELFPVSPFGMNDDDMEVDKILISSEAEALDFQNEKIYMSEGFQLTSRGNQMMKKKDVWFSWSCLSDEKKKILTDFKTIMVSRPLKEILKYVYAKYPKYAEKSTIYQRLFPGGDFK